MFSCFIIPKVYQSCDVRGQTERKDDEKKQRGKKYDRRGGKKHDTQKQNKHDKQGAK